MKLNSIAYSFALGALILAALTTFARAQSGGRFDLSWSTIDGGGGTSSGGQFQLSGTIGQPDAGTLTGGTFKLEGGFWSGVSVAQTPGAPMLKIKFIGGGLAVISWPVNAQGFALEESSAVGTGVWSTTVSPVHDTAMEHTVTIPAIGAMKCYRLRK
jgi:hypothetical protein